MSVSDVDIANLALTKLGAQPIVSFLDANPRAAVMNRSYAILRDKLQRRRWNFNRVYVTLAASSVAPTFEYTYAYPLPADYLRLELATQATPQAAPLTGNQISAAPPMMLVGMPGANLTDYNSSRAQDYRIVGKMIYSRYFPPLSIIYGKREPDPNQFDAAFVDAFACYLAWQNCEAITNSNAKKAAAQQEYKESMWEALNLKAIELPPETIPDDTWMLARLVS